MQIDNWQIPEGEAEHPDLDLDDLDATVLIAEDEFPAGPPKRWNLLPAASSDNPGNASEDSAWKESGQAFYERSPLLQTYEPAPLFETFLWITDHQAQLEHKSIFYIVRALASVGKLSPRIPLEMWERSAGAFALALEYRETITQEIQRIFARPAARHYQSMLKRLRTEFDSPLLRGIRSGNPLL